MSAKWIKSTEEEPEAQDDGRLVRNHPLDQINVYSNLMGEEVREESERGSE